MSWTKKRVAKKSSTKKQPATVSKKRGSKKVSSKVVKKDDDNFVPEKYQEKVIRFGLARACVAIFLDPGMGKSAILLMIFKLLLHRKLVHTLLIVAPKIVCETTWNTEEPGSELNKWKQFRHFKAIFLHGTKKAKLLRETADIFIVTPDGVKWLLDEILNDRSLKNKFDMLGVDESTKFKSHTKLTKNKKPTRFGALRQLLPMFKRRYIMTGTPASNSLQHLFSQIFILDEGHALGRYVTRFRNTYFTPGKELWQWFPKSNAEELIYKQLKNLVIRMDRDDYINMPPIVYIDKVFTLDAKSQKIYDELEQDLITQIENDTIVAKNAGVASGKIRQVVNGGLYLKKGSDDAKIIHTLKAEIAAELVDELNGKPALILFEFHHDLDRLLKQFGKNTPYVAGGGRRSAPIATIQKEWNKGKMPVLLAQMTTIAHGVNLQTGGRAIIWHSNTYDREIYIQVRDRIYRRGQTKKVFVYHIMAKDTVDFIMAYTRARKGNVEKNLLDSFKSIIKKRKKRTARK